MPSPYRLLKEGLKLNYPKDVEQGDEALGGQWHVPDWVLQGE